MIFRESKPITIKKKLEFLNDNVEIHLSWKKPPNIKNYRINISSESELNTKISEDVDADKEEFCIKNLNYNTKYKLELLLYLSSEKSKCVSVTEDIEILPGNDIKI